MIYSDVDKCRALVVDSNPTSRSTLVSMLRDMGVGHVVPVSQAIDARRALENRVFDIVLCDYHFDRSEMSGQSLLDDLRRAQLLPYSTVFVMVTGEASYSHVAEVAEAALDSYLLKPHTATALEERLLAARHRKLVLRDIFEALETEDFATAARLCAERFERRDEFWLYAARIGAELYLRLGQHDLAKGMYEAVHASKALPWAKLGVARAELEQGQLPQARRTLESLISEQPSYADAYDVMGRVQVEQGDLNAALETFRTAIRTTPASITRLQKQGMLAFYCGCTDEAIEALERCMRIGVSSKMFDCQSLLLLALLYFDRRDTKSFQRVHDTIAQTVEKRPDSRRLQRFLEVSEVFRLLFARRLAECVAQVRAMAPDLRSEDFDFEAASNMLSLLARLRATEVQLDDSETWVGQIAQRFCVSKASTDMLCRAAQGHPAYVTAVREGHAQITTTAERAVSHSVTGSPLAAVQTLMDRGRETLNAKLIELAGMVLNRHAARIGDSAALGPQIQALKTRFCTKGTQVALGQSGGRAAGGISLRA
ncbi:response regulator [Piscinibacter sakaiensis]